jgi:hypothetical protein
MNTDKNKTSEDEHEDDFPSVSLWFIACLCSSVSSLVEKLESASPVKWRQKKNFIILKKTHKLLKPLHPFARQPWEHEPSGAALEFGRGCARDGRAPI